MNRLAVLCALASSGCATSWLVVQASGSSLAIADHHRDELVPKPGVEEHLRIAVPLLIGTGPATIRCTTEQIGTSTRYASELHYGRSWKWTTAVMFAAEATLAAVLYVEGRDAPHEDWLGAAYLGADAAVTAGLFFIPQRTVVTTDEVPITTEVRSDCPDGLVLEIGGDAFPIDAAGSIGEVGTAALAAAYAKVAVPLSVSFDGDARALVREPPPPCTAQPCAAPLAPVASATFVLPEGTLTSLNTVSGT